MAKRKASRDPLGGLSDRAKEYTEEETYVESVGAGRKRRSDATGRKKKDYHVGTSTLALRVPDALADRVKATAEAEGLSVSAWLTGLIEAHFGRD